MNLSTPVRKFGDVFMLRKAGTDTIFKLLKMRFQTAGSVVSPCFSLCVSYVAAFVDPCTKKSKERPGWRMSLW